VFCEGRECPMKLGYARVSTDDQNLDHQRERLHGAGCERLFEEKISGARRDRPELALVVEVLVVGGDTCVAQLHRALPAFAEHPAKEPISA
jgi:DNA invertase Pin-like site-specific DNA recombinase